VNPTNNQKVGENALIQRISACIPFPSPASCGGLKGISLLPIIQAAMGAGEGPAFRGFLERRLPGRDRRIPAVWAGIGRAIPRSGDDTGVFNPLYPPHQRGIISISTSTTIIGSPFHPFSYGMSDVTIMVPRDIVQALRLPPDAIQAALQQELALALYQRGILSSGKACALAGVKRWEWEILPGARKIPRHYADEDLDQDIAYAAGGQ